jgi:hypothetical protein
VRDALPPAHDGPPDGERPHAGLQFILTEKPAGTPGRCLGRAPTEEALTTSSA